MATTLTIPKSSAVSKWSGAAFIIGNVLFFLNKLDEMSRVFFSRWMPDVISGQDPLIILAGQGLLIAGYLGIYRHYSPLLDRPAQIALRLFSTGGIVLAVGHIGFMRVLGEILPAAIRPYAEAFFVFVILGLTMLLGGLIWFGIRNLRRPALSRWQWLPLATGLAGFTGFFMTSGEATRDFFLIFRTLFALGLAGLGLVLWLEKSE